MQRRVYSPHGDQPPSHFPSQANMNQSRFRLCLHKTAAFCPPFNANEAGGMGSEPCNTGPFLFKTSLCLSWWALCPLDLIKNLPANKRTSERREKHYMILLSPPFQQSLLVFNNTLLLLSY